MNTPATITFADFYNRIIINYLDGYSQKKSLQFVLELIVIMIIFAPKHLVLS
jgi:hypothetical protein